MKAVCGNFLIGNNERVDEKSVFWNMMSSGLNSVVSIILLWFVTKVNGTSDTGVFSLGFSTAQLMLTIGNYGMRNFQATDIENKYSMGNYLASRILTTVGMMAAGVGFVLVEGYYQEKAIIILSLCLLKVTDAFDDLYGGFYQKQGRLDISGKILFFRVAIYSAVFVTVLMITQNLIISILFSIIASAGILIWMIRKTKASFCLELPKFQWNKLGKLMRECLPLCIGTFLLIYIGNVPKYAIDAQMNNDMQAYYTYLFMPCFVINLFVGFALQPLLVRLSQTWMERRFQMFAKLCLGIVAITLIISAVVVGGGALLGCPALSLFFGVDLSAYRKVLIILLIGGGFYAFAVVAQIILTVMRHQFSLLWGIGAASLFATKIAPVFVKQMGLEGAAYVYTLSAGLLFIIFLLLIILYGIKEGKAVIGATVDNDFKK